MVRQPRVKTGDADLLEGYTGIEGGVGKMPNKFRGSKRNRVRSRGLNKMEKVVRYGKDTDITPLFGNTTAQRALCDSAERLHLWKQKQKDNVESLALDVLVAALICCQTIMRDKKRAKSTKYCETARIYQSALNRATKILLKESDHLRRRGHQLQDDQPEQAELLCQEALIKANLASDLKRILGQSAPFVQTQDSFSISRILKRGILDVCQDYSSL